MAKDPQPENGPEALKALAESVDEPWFTAVCQLASVFPRGNYTDEVEQDLLKLFFGTGDIDKWLDPVPDENEDGDDEPPVKIKFECLGPFNNFRRIDNALTLEPKGNVTLVFGNNGSGKTSLSLALRCLAKAGRPEQMLRNVDQPHAASSFRYKLADDADETAWDEQAGYGKLSNSIAYYDGHVASSLVRDPADPHKMVEVTPFGLEVFKVAGNLVKGLEEDCKAWDNRLSEMEVAALKALRDVCEEVDFIAESTVQDDHDRLLQSLADDPPEWDGEKDAERIGTLREQIKKNKELLQPERLESLRRQRADLFAEYGRVRKGLDDLRRLLGVDEIAIHAKLEEDRKLRSELLARILKQGQSEQAFIEMLKSAEKVAPLSGEIGECPLCTQAVDGEIAERFEKYKEVLAATIQADIDAAEQELASLAEIRARLSRRLGEFALDVASEYLPEAEKQVAERIKADLVESVGVEEFKFQSSDGFVENVDRYSRYRAWLRKSLAETKKLLDDIQEREAEIRKEIEEGESELRTLLKAKLVQDHADEFKKLAELRGKLKILRKKVSDASWSTKKQRLSTESRSISGRLVLDGFEESLDAEYKAITGGRGMASFGVRLGITVEGQQVSANASVGASGSRMIEVLSEGEQRLHAAALFFAETKLTKPDVVALDDPAVSFDFNYTDGVVNRIIKHALDHRDAQIIVFTHSWEFFVKFFVQLEKKKRIVNGFDFSAYELAACSHIEDHEPNLKTRKQTLLAQINGQSDPIPEGVARGISTLVRVFIEQIINHYIFANQRQSFRSGHVASIAMHEFRKVRPMSEDHALRLDEVASAASSWMHDNTQGGPVVPSRGQFLEWYNNVCAVMDEMQADKDAEQASP